MAIKMARVLSTMMARGPETSVKFFSRESVVRDGLQQKQEQVTCITQGTHSLRVFSVVNVYRHLSCRVNGVLVNVQCVYVTPCACLLQPINSVPVL